MKKALRCNCVCDATTPKGNRFCLTRTRVRLDEIEGVRLWYRITVFVVVIRQEDTGLPGSWTRIIEPTKSRVAFVPPLAALRNTAALIAGQLDLRRRISPQGMTTNHEFALPPARRWYV